MPYARIMRTEAAPPNSAPQTKATMATMAIGIPPYARITRTETPPNSAPHTKAKLGTGIPPIAHRDNAGPPLAVLAEVTPQHRADSGDNPMAIRQPPPLKLGIVIYLPTTTTIILRGTVIRSGLGRTIAVNVGPDEENKN